MTETEKMIITKYDLLYEQRITKVETTLENLDKYIREASKDMKETAKEMKTDFRWIVIIMLGGFGTLFGLMAHGFKWL
jgi:hypothetical protein